MNKRIKSQKKDEEVSYWQTVADALAALLLVILLVAMLLILYLIRIPNFDNIDPYPGDHYTGMEDELVSEGDVGDSETDDEGKKDKEHDADGNGGGRDGGDGESNHLEDERYRYPVEGFDEDSGKAAVFVQVIDAETGSIIKKQGIRFELYSQQKSLQLLHTYYPVKVEYQEYETTKDGTFYLPEKIAVDTYFLRSLNTPDGYDPVNDMNMDIQRSYDWSEPYVEKVSFFPSKNIIRIQMNDADTNEPIKGAVYDVVAAEDITTADGTMRYAKGTVADQIKCDKNGYGESIELYLGKYLLRESTIPMYYAADEFPTEVEVEQRNGDILPDIHEMLCEQTTITVSAIDELYANVTLSDVSFALTYDGESKQSQTYETDQFGKIVLNQLLKNTTYHLRQLTTTKGYRPVTEEYVIHVNEQGRIEFAEEEKVFQTVKYDLLALNRTLRTAIGVQDLLLRNLVSDYNVAVFDENGNVVDAWDSTGLAHTIEGLSTGSYFIRINGQERGQKKIEIQDTKEVQTISIPVITPQGIAALASLLVAVFGLILLIRFLRKKRRKQTEI